MISVKKKRELQENNSNKKKNQTNQKLTNLGPHKAQKHITVFPSTEPKKPSILTNLFTFGLD